MKVFLSRPSRARGLRAAFTFLELLLVMLIISILMGLLLPALEKGRKRARRAECVSNLRQVGIAYHGFSQDHADRFPFQVPVKEGGTLEFVKAVGSVRGAFYFAYRHFQALSNELLTTKVLLCPSDKRTNAASFAALLNHNIGYMVGATAEFTKPDSILSGDYNISDGIDAGSLLRLSPNSPAAWTSGSHEYKGNLLFSDTRVEEVGTGGLLAAIANSGLPVNTLLPPTKPPDGFYPDPNAPPPISTVAALQEYFKVQTASTPASALPSEPASPPAPPPVHTRRPSNAPPTPASQPGALIPVPAVTTVEQEQQALIRGKTTPVRPEPVEADATNAGVAAMGKATNTGRVTAVTPTAEAKTEPAGSMAEEMAGILLNPERCWICWIVALILALVVAIVLGRHVFRQRREGRRLPRALSTSRLRG